MKQKQYINAYVKEVKEGGNIIGAVATTDTPDRDGEILSIDGWELDNFIKNPILLWGHDSRALPIGKVTNIKRVKNSLLFDAQFAVEENDFAAKVSKLVAGGYLNTFSVGFLPKQKEGDKFTKQELLEISVVNVPANPEAEVSRAYKDFQKTVKSVEKKVETKEVKKESMKEKENVEIKIVERWNKQLSEIFDKSHELLQEDGGFDINNLLSRASTYEHDVYSKYLGCAVKDIYLNNYVIPSPMLGTYLKSFKEILGQYTLKDERSFDYNGGEKPLIYEVIQLNSKKSEDFLIEGVQFYENEEVKFIVKFHPAWFGMIVDIVTATSQRKENKNLLNEVHKYAEEHNQLKGQIFALSGEFLKKTTDKWEDLVLLDEIKNPIKKAIAQLKKDGKNSKNRGLMFIGPPGTGKTKTGKVLMNDYDDAAFIWASSKDFDKVGPITALKIGFELARKIAPSILFLEDIDTWLKDHVIDLLKIEMDGIKENKGMITILTSNNPEKFPDALLDRPGRFHEVINFSLPTKVLRKKMIEKWANIDVEDKIMCDILEKTKGFSGAHMYELVDYAKMIVQDEGIDLGKALLESLEKIVSQRELIHELKNKLKKKLSKKIKKEKEKEKVKEIKDTKSPACRQESETQQQCVARKIPEIIKEGTEPKQAIAIAFSMCSKPCKSKDESEIEEKEEAKELPKLDIKTDDIKKEGRIVSEKNRILIRNTVSTLKEASIALEELLKKTEPPTGEPQVGKTSTARKDPMVLRALKRLDREIEHLILTEKGK